MLYRYSLLNLSSCIVLNDLRQKARASSMDSPRICNCYQNQSHTYTGQHTYLQEKTILQPSVVLEVLVSPEAHVQVAHARRVMFVCHFVNHVGGQRPVSTFGLVAPFRRNSSLEALGEVIEKWN